jgi:hypothetical protein
VDFVIVGLALTMSVGVVVIILTAGRLVMKMIKEDLSFRVE